MKTSNFSAGQMALAALGGAAVGWFLRPRVVVVPAGRGLLPAGQVPVYAVGGGNVAVGTPYNQALDLYRRLAVGNPWVVDLPWTDQQIAQFLGQNGLNCASWSRLSLAQKRTYFGLTLRLEGPANTHVYADARIHQVDAYCLKLAVQGESRPVTSSNVAPIRSRYGA